MIAWVPAHSVVSGNNFTDAEAKKAVSSGMFEDHIGFQFKTLRSLLKVNGGVDKENRQQIL